jgi:ankyrin repeat protein
MPKQKKEAIAQPTNVHQQLIEAVGNGDVRAVCRCLDAGADPNTRGADGRPLFFALGRWPRDPWPIRGEIIRAGADVTVRDEVGSTILHAAAGADHVETVELVLGRGMDIEILDHFGETALHEAARCGALNAVKALIESGADVFAENPEGKTPKDLIDYNNVVTCYEIEFELEQAMAEGADDQDDDDEVTE